MGHITDMTLDETKADIREEFSFLDDWEARYAHLIDLGKTNTPLAPEERNEQTRVRGCASQVWLVSDTSQAGTLIFRAESDAMIVSGLIALLLRLVSDRRPADILAFDAAAFLEDIGVTGALTAQRSNGLASMIKRINDDAAAAARQEDA
ncbi:MAG: SufE family protein [Pseudomonadota bacterium]